MAWEGKRLQSLSGNNTTASYTYDEQGVRSSKTVNGVTTTFHYNGSLLMAQVQGSGSSQVKQLYSYDANGDVISVNYNGTEYYYLRNGQTDIVGLMDGSGTKMVEYTYDAWGKLISTTGTLANTLGADNPFRYRGYYYDTETGLYYLMTRYYDPEVCRFISADVYMSTGQGIVGNNMFAYCLNNPVNMTDTNGQWPEWATKIAIGLGAILIGAVVVAATVTTGGAAAAFIGAAIAGVKAAAVSGAIAAAVGAGTQAVSHRVSTGSWEGAGEAALNGAVNGFADGFMTGGIMAGASQVLSGGFKVAANLGVKTGRKGGIPIGDNAKILSPNNSKFYESGGTLLKIGSKAKNVRIDVGAKSLLHMNIEIRKSNIHVPLGKIASGLYGGIRALLK